MKNFKAVLAGLAIVFVWSGWIILSRHGVHTQLQPADITLLRYWTAFVVVLPMVIRYPWRQHTLWQYLVIGLGVGFPYTMLSFYGLKVIPAAHAGVLVNGMLPVLGAIAAWLLFKQRIAPHRYFAIGVIFAANLVMAGEFSSTWQQLLGAALLLTAAVCYISHMTGIRLWGMNWLDVIVIVPVVNVLLFTPIWPLFPSVLLSLPPSQWTTSLYHDMALQAIYQGVIVNVLALMCATYAIRNLGTITVALFMSFVPVTTAILAWLLLGEVLDVRAITGIVGCSLGLIWYAREPRSHKLV